MAISSEDVRKIAELARLHVVDEELESLTRDINEVLVFLEKLSELDMKKVSSEPEIMDGHSVLRPDREAESTLAEAIRSAACSPRNDFFSVPSVMEKNEPPGTP